MTSRIGVKRLSVGALGLITLALFTGCSKTSGGDSTGSTTATSVSEAAATAIAGAVNSSDSSASSVGLREVMPARGAVAWVMQAVLEPLAMAITRCPIAPYGHASTGTATSSTVITLTYSNCTPYGSLLAKWNGSQILTFDSAGTLTAYTAGTATSGSVTRTFSGGIGSTVGTITASSPTYRTSAVDTVVYVDSNLADLICYSGANCGSTITSGGVTTTFGSGTRSMKINGIRMVGAVNAATTAATWDHTIYTPTALTVTGQGASKTISAGSVTVYHNRIGYTATATISQTLTWTSASCHPSSGQITTTCPTGTTNTSETFTYVDSSSATLVDCSGNTTTVSLSHCI